MERHQNQLLFWTLSRLLYTDLCHKKMSSISTWTHSYDYPKCYVINISLYRFIWGPILSLRLKIDSPDKTRVLIQCFHTFILKFCMKDPSRSIFYLLTTKNSRIFSVLKKYYGLIIKLRWNTKDLPFTADYVDMGVTFLKSFSLKSFRLCISHFTLVKICRVISLQWDH